MGDGMRTLVDIGSEKRSRPARSDTCGAAFMVLVHQLDKIVLFRSFELVEVVP